MRTSKPRNTVEKRKPAEKIRRGPVRQAVAPPSTLSAIQRLMFDTIRRPLSSGERMRRDSAGAADAIIKPNDRLTSFERLQIYNQQYWWRMLANFADDFHGLRAVVGVRKFDRLAVAYLDACPSRSWTLRNLGSRVPEFLASHPGLTAPHSALALDVARVEWARTVAFDERELPRIDPARIARTPPDRLRFGVQPHVQLLELRHPVDELLLRPVGTSRQLITFVKDRPGHDRRYAIDASKLCNELGWAPSIQFEEGFRETAKWYLDNDAWLQKITSGDYQKYYEQQYAKN